MKKKTAKNPAKFNPTITKEWLLATMEMEGSGFCNAGGKRGPGQPPKGRTAHVSLNMPPELKEAIQAAAAIERVSLTDYVIDALDERVKKSARKRGSK